MLGLARPSMRYAPSPAFCTRQFSSRTTRASTTTAPASAAYAPARATTRKPSAGNADKGSPPAALRETRKVASGGAVASKPAKTSKTPVEPPSVKGEASMAPVGSKAAVDDGGEDEQEDLIARLEDVPEAPLPSMTSEDEAYGDPCERFLIEPRLSKLSDAEVEELTKAAMQALGETYQIPPSGMSVADLHKQIHRTEAMDPNADIVPLSGGAAPAPEDELDFEDDEKPLKLQQKPAAAAVKTKAPKRSPGVGRADEEERAVAREEAEAAQAQSDALPAGPGLTKVNTREKAPQGKREPLLPRMWMGWDKQKKQGLEIAYGAWSDSFVVINKPAGIPVEDAANQADTVASRVRKIFAEQNLAHDHVIFPHRIDKWASGLQVVAFDTHTASRLQRSMAQGLWHKRYRLLVQMPSCVVEEQRKAADSFVDESEVRRKSKPTDLPAPRRCAMMNPLLRGSFVSGSQLIPKGKVTSYIAVQRSDNVPPVPGRGCANCDCVVEHLRHHPFVIRHLLYRSVPASDAVFYFGARRASTFFLHRHSNLDLGVALYEAVPQTGRTHQLRIHFSDAGFPIVGDPYYNPAFIEWMRAPNHRTKFPYLLEKWVKQPTHMGLQASLLKFPHPFKDETIHLMLPDPPSWAAMLGKDYDAARSALSQEPTADLDTSPPPPRIRPAPAAASKVSDGFAPQAPDDRFRAFLQALKEDTSSNVPVATATPGKTKSSPTGSQFQKPRSRFAAEAAASASAVLEGPYVPKPDRKPGVIHREIGGQEQLRPAPPKAAATAPTPGQ